VTDYNPPCVDCIHLLPKVPGVTFSCKAFPQGVPRDHFIQVHREVVPGQVGEFVYSPRPGADPSPPSMDEVMSGATT
jgi:hypothetical protein